MAQNGFRAFKPQGEYLISSAMPENYGEGVHLGQYRVKFTWAPCGTVNLIAQ
jgi:hypothetical protein